MRSDILPSEHVFALCVNLIVISMAFSSLVLLVPRFLDQSAKLAILNQEVELTQNKVGDLEAQMQRARVLPQATARAQANMVPNSRVSVLWGR